MAVDVWEKIGESSPILNILQNEDRVKTEGQR